MQSLLKQAKTALQQTLVRFARRLLAPHHYPKMPARMVTWMTIIMECAKMQSETDLFAPSGA